jgi:predicted Zn-dependent peptidase
MELQKGKVNDFNIVHVKKTSPIAFLLFLVKNGSRMENDKNAGISHFVEHMMFKQTETRTTKQIATEIETMGGDTNAFTSFDHTGYYIKVLKENFDPAFEILSDILQNGTFAEEDIEIEKGNIIEEIKMYEDSPMDYISDLSFANAFPDSNLGRMIIGTEENVKSFTRDDLVNFVQSNYLQEDFLIVSVGDFDISATEKNVKKYLRPRKKGVLTIEPTQFNPKEKVSFLKKGEANQAHVFISFPGVATTDKNLYKYSVLEEVLGEGSGSILFDLLREQLGVAYYVGVEHSDFTDTGIFQIYFGANNNKTKLTLDKIFEQLEKLKTTLITPEELKRAHNHYYSSLAMHHESLSFLGQKYGAETLLEGKTESLEEAKEKIYAVTAEDLMEVAKVIFTDNYNISYIADKKII